MDHIGVEAVKALKHTKLTTTCEVRHLTNLLGCYRRNIPNFSRIAKLLYYLLTGTNDWSFCIIHKIDGPNNTRSR